MLSRVAPVTPAIHTGPDDPRESRVVQSGFAPRIFASIRVSGVPPVTPRTTDPFRDSAGADTAHPLWPLVIVLGEIAARIASSREADVVPLEAQSKPAGGGERRDA